MEVAILNKDKTEGGKRKLPQQFNEPLREDLIKRAVLTIEANTRQPYGSYEDAGMRHSADVSRRRRKYRGSYGHGISRVPRKVMSRRGTQMFWRGAEAPGTVGGRKAHSPKASKIWSKKLNIKERRKAIRSALAAVMDPSLVKERGHKVPANYPFLLHNDFEALVKSKEVQKALRTLGLKEELSRCEVKKIRSGKGKVRARPYKKKKGPLLVVSEKCNLQSAAKNLAGVDIIPVSELNAKLLAPGCHPGRLTLFTDKAVEKIEKEGLFL